MRKGQRENTERRLLISYLTLRRLVGSLGLVLPLLLVVGDTLSCRRLGLRSSISAYYQSDMGDVFVGVLFVIGWFLFSYRGYEDVDDRVGNLAGVLAMGVALCPSSAGGMVQTIHAVSAALFFLALAYFSLCLFTRTADDREPTREKLRRNRVYRVCGGAIVFSLLAIAVVWGLEKLGHTPGVPLIFWFESLALWAFGFSWCVKGEVLWRDTVGAPPQKTTSKRP